jgi:hypothetical protein
VPVSIFQRSNNQDVGPWELADLEQESHTESFLPIRTYSIRRSTRSHGPTPY